MPRGELVEFLFDDLFLLGTGIADLGEAAMCGKLFKTSAPFQITEDDSDFVVSCQKHVYANHLVLQFDVTNTLEGHVLEVCCCANVCSFFVWVDSSFE